MRSVEMGLFRSDYGATNVSLLLRKSNFFLDVFARLLILLLPNLPPYKTRQSNGMRLLEWTLLFLGVGAEIRRNLRRKLTSGFENYSECSRLDCVGLSEHTPR